MDTYAPLIATAVSALVFAGLKWLGQRTSRPWHRWVIPGVTAALALLRMGGKAVGVDLPEFPIDAAIGTSTALAVHQTIKGAGEKPGPKT